MASPVPEASRRGEARRIAALLCGALIVASCVADPPAPAPSPPAEPPAEAAAPPESPPSVTAVPPAPAPAPRPRIEFDPGSLAGMNEAALTGLLGDPAFIRRDAPAQLWRYRHASCVLDLYLYSPREAPDERPKVRHYEVRGTGGRDVTDRDCLVRLLEARAAEQAGKS